MTQTVPPAGNGSVDHHTPRVQQESTEDEFTRGKVQRVVQRKNARLGMTLFFVYLLMYLGFVLANAFSASSMEMPVIAGLNLAIVYGFGLIFSAVVMALVYGFLCQTDEEEETE